MFEVEVAVASPSHKPKQAEPSLPNPRGTAPTSPLTNMQGMPVSYDVLYTQIVVVLLLARYVFTLLWLRTLANRLAR